MSKYITILSSGLKPWFYYLDQAKSDCSGIQCDIINYLARSLNFTYNVIINTNGIGSKLPNNSWSGAIRLLLDNVSKYRYSHAEKFYSQIRLKSIQVMSYKTL